MLLVEDGSGGTALQAARDLGRAGRRIVLASSSDSYAARSRWCDVAVRVGPAGSAGFVDEVCAVCRAHGVSVILPCGDPELLALSADRDRLPATLALPEHRVVLAALDKRALSTAAVAAGLAVPATEQADGPPALEPPLVVKAGTRAGDVGPGTAPTVPAADRNQAHRAALALQARGLPALYQQRVVGRLGAVVVLLARDGRVLARLQQVAEAVFPLGAGNCVRGRTVPIDEELVGRVVALLRGLGWHGLAQVELVQPPVGPPVVLDLNGRVYGSMGLAAAAGLALPELAVRDLLGQPLPAYAEARVGASYQARGQDLRRAVVERTPSLVADLSGTMRYRADTHQVWAADDPAPLRALSRMLGGRALRRAGRGAGR